MNVLLADSPIVEVHRPRVQQPLCLPTTSAASAPPLREQVWQRLRAFGLTKIDILIFIAVYAFVTLLVMFMCFAARIGHTQAWVWGLHLMNVPLALAGLSLLAAATLAAGAALLLVRRPSRWPTIVALGLATLCCTGFVATILMDVDAKWSYGVRPGDQFSPNDRYVARHFGVKLPKKSPEAKAAQIVVVAPIVRSVSSTSGRKLFLGTCMSCHGPYGEGLPGQGKSLLANEFVGSLDDAKLLNFLKVGRQPWDPLNTTRVQMPPRGGNPMLSDDDLRDIVAYVRSLQTPAPAISGQSASGASATMSAPVVEDIDPALLIPRCVAPPPPPGPAGLSPEYLAECRRPQWKSPRDGVAFVNTYYVAAQFGGAHAGAVAISLAALFVQALRGRITAERRVPLALAMVGCAVMTIWWLVVFPFIYVI